MILLNIELPRDTGVDADRVARTAPHSWHLRAGGGAVHSINNGSPDSN